MHKYKIHLGRDVSNFKKALIALVDSGMFVYSRLRHKSMASIGDDTVLECCSQNADWLIIGYIDDYHECERTLFTSDYGWRLIGDYTEISLEGFLQLKEAENARTNTHT